MATRGRKARSSGAAAGQQGAAVGTLGMAASPAEQPRLGTVMRFTPGAKASGIKQLETGGFKVASSSDFKAAAAVPNNFGGADVQYFERFGIAIVRRDEERLTPMLNKAIAAKVVTAARPERTYRALGAASRNREYLTASSGPARADAQFEYLRGYRDAVNTLVDRVLGGAPVTMAARGTPQFDETSVSWGLQAVLLPQSTLTGAGIKVCVLDTGIDERHPDFQGRAITKKIFTSNSSPDDVDGHGTHCTGTACGPLHPASGPRYGVAYEAEIFSGKVLGDDGLGTDRSVIAGMDWALEQGCHIISMSLGAATNLGDSPNGDYEQIGQVCLDAGTLIIAAAGNESRRPGRINPIGSPANASTIMAVGAIDRDFAIARFSCGGLNPGQDVDIAGPGVDILSAVPGGGYDRWDGTSMATPHVSGVAALIAQSDATFRGWALWTRLLQLARPLELPARDVGRGLLQAPPR